MLSFFKVPFSSKKPFSTEEISKDVLFDILRKRHKDNPGIQAEHIESMLESYQKRLKEAVLSSNAPESQYLAITKILRDLDNQLD